jgi:MoaE-MoaD fusion protein
MHARVLFFGSLKDVVGTSAEEAEFPDGADLGAVFERYAARYPRIREMARSIVLARNHEFAGRSTPLEDGDEVAFLPPVSGGSPDGHYFALTRAPIDPRAIAARIQTGAEGAIVTFEGTVRNNTAGRATRCLDYECYEPMALKLMAEIGQSIAASHQVSRVAIVHRLGRLLVGETSIAIVVTAPHRRAAFDAALEAINRVKKTVPIWKKEYFVDGEVWVEGEWDSHVPVVG